MNINQQYIQNNPPNPTQFNIMMTNQPQLKVETETETKPETETETEVVVTVELSANDTVIMADEVVPWTRKCCDNCWNLAKADANARNECIQNCNKRCSEQYTECITKWVACGERTDERLRNNCKLKYGDDCAKKCCCVCFKFCNRAWFPILIIFIGTSVFVVVMATQIF